MSDTAVVFGKPVNGDIHETSKPVDQADPSILEDAIEALFEFPQVEAFKWDQYTPYFNDGEACEFGVNAYSLGISFYGLDEDESDYRDNFYRIEDGLIDYDWERNPTFRRINERLCEPVAAIIPEDIHSDLIETLTNLYTEFDNGTHEVFLKRAFGDHATVTGTREGFDVEYYEHD